MQVWQFSPNKVPCQCDQYDVTNDEGFSWVIVNHQELDALLLELEKKQHFKLHLEHHDDCFNDSHPCFFDAMHDYKFLVFRSLRLEKGSIDAQTQSLTFILRDRLLITVHEDDAAVALVCKRLKDTSRTLQFKSPDILLYQVLTTVVDQFLMLRERLTEEFAKWQKSLLSCRKRFDAWHEFLNYKSATQRFYLLCEGQLDAIDQWQQNVDEDVTRHSHHAQVHLADLASHIRRGLKFSQQLQYQVDSLMQLHYSFMTSVTNQVVQVLTVISAIFLPLTLLTGIFGMNFEHMPFLSWRIGFYIVIAVMVFIILILLFIFKRKRWT